MRKIIRFKLVALLTTMSLTTRAQEMDTLKVQSDSVVWNESLKEVSVVASSIRTEGDRTTAFITKGMTGDCPLSYHDTSRASKFFECLQEHSPLE